MRNVEFKAELRDPAIARATCRSLKATPILVFEQIDTYYRVPTGRLKMRETEGEPAEWILYDRPNTVGFKTSEYTILTHEQAIERYGAAPLPVWVIVRKRRDLWMLGNIRIHLDEVYGLGWFLEFEAIVSRDHPEEACRLKLAELRAAFRPVLGEAIDRSYSDLLALDQDEASQSRPGGAAL